MRLFFKAPKLGYGNPIVFFDKNKIYLHDKEEIRDFQNKKNEQNKRLSKENKLKAFNFRNIN
jgi:hypothetical protein